MNKKIRLILVACLSLILFTISIFAWYQSVHPNKITFGLLVFVGTIGFAFLYLISDQFDLIVAAIFLFVAGGVSTVPDIRDGYLLVLLWATVVNSLVILWEIGRWLEKKKIDDPYSLFG